MKNEYALITGATSGFGYEFARLFAKDGYHLILIARSADRLRDVAYELSSRYNIHVFWMAEDLFDPSAAERIYHEVRNRNYLVSVLVNDAGQGEYGKFTETDLHRELDIIQLNVSSLVSLTKYFLRLMVRRNEGKILQVSSLLGKMPSPLMAVYSGTKAFVIAFTEALINELKDTNVTVTALLPGASDTDFFHKANAEDTVTYRETSLSSPEDVAKEGYEALMKGERRVITGFKNKMQAAMSNLMPDDKVAESIRKQMEPSDEDEGRTRSSHPVSAEEREHIANR